MRSSFLLAVMLLVIPFSALAESKCETTITNNPHAVWYIQYDYNRPTYTISTPLPDILQH